MKKKATATKFNFFKKFGSTLGVVSVLISVYPAYHISEFVRPILMYVIPLINKIIFFLPKLFLGLEPGWFEHTWEIIIIFGGTGFVYGFIAIFVPMIIFSQIIKKEINWKPAIYILFFWLAYVEDKSDLKILGQDTGGYNRFTTLWLPIIFHGAGLFGTLIFAYAKIDKK